MFIIYTYLSVSDEPQKEARIQPPQNFKTFQINLLALKPFGLI